MGMLGTLRELRAAYRKNAAILGYHDDIHVVVSPGNATAVVRELVARAHSDGMEVSPAKCQVFGVREREAYDPVSLADDGEPLPFVSLSTSCVKVLGVPLGCGEAVNRFLDAARDKLQGKLQLLRDCGGSTHEASFVLQSCGPAMVGHLLRTVPPSLSERFATDAARVLREVQAELLILDERDLRGQAETRYSQGGLGLRSLPAYVKAAYYAGQVAAMQVLACTHKPLVSAYGVGKELTDVHAEFFGGLQDTSLCNATLNHDCAVDAPTRLQARLSAPISVRIEAEVLRDASLNGKLRIEHLRGGGWCPNAWIAYHPTEAHVLAPNLYRIAVRLRLGLPPPSPFYRGFCPRCHRATADDPTHAFSCNKAGKGWKHMAVKLSDQAFLRAAGFSPVFNEPYWFSEELGLETRIVPDTLYSPDGVQLRGLDNVVPNSSARTASSVPFSAFRTAAARKAAHYRPLVDAARKADPSSRFTVLVNAVDCYGCMSADYQEWFRDVLRMGSQQGRHLSIMFWKHKYSWRIQRSVALTLHTHWATVVTPPARLGARGHGTVHT